MTRQRAASLKPGEARMTATGNYLGVRYTEFDGAYYIDRFSDAPVFWSVGAMQRWIGNNIIHLQRLGVCPGWVA